MARLIQVGNLPDSIASVDLRQLFEAHGAVRSAVIAKHLETGRSTGVGFVEMALEDGGTVAIAALNHREHHGRVLSVCWCKSPKNRATDRQQMFGSMNMISE
jgi:RNA recognition motif-containing protein